MRRPATDWSSDMRECTGRRGSSEMLWKFAFRSSTFTGENILPPASSAKCFRTLSPRLLPSPPSPAELVLMKLFSLIAGDRRLSSRSVRSRFQHIQIAEDLVRTHATIHGFTGISKWTVLTTPLLWNWTQTRYVRGRGNVRSN